MQKKILIAEDDLALLDVLSSKVKSLNYAVIEARDGAQALRKFKNELPDLVLLDIIMPVKSGFEVLEEIKMKRKSKIPVIVLSNLEEEEDIETGMNLGATDFITKSNFTLKEIMVKVNKSIEKNE
jgi:DNA-binding response OmpR family regulator